MFDCKVFCRVMDQSGLLKRELTTLYGVSRQTLYLWRKRAPHQQLLAERAAAYTTALATAMDKKVLPMAASVSSERRAEFIARIALRLYALTAPR